MRSKATWLNKILALQLAAVLLLAGCSAGSPDPDGSRSPDSTGVPGTARDVLNVALTQESATYDLHKISSNANKMVCQGNVYEKLVTLDSNSQAVPELCEKFEISDDSKEFTFYLRKGVKFHDGSEMTAEDVVASMNRWLEAFSNARALAGDSRFEEVDDYTVKITLPQPVRTFVDVIAGAGQPAAITTAASCSDEDERGFLREYIGTGPYRFVEWAQDQYILLERFDEYVPYGDPNEPIDGWAGYKHAYIRQIYYYYVPDITTRVAGLETGQYDVIWTLTDDNLERIENTEDLVVQKVTESGATIVFNKREGIGTDKYLRQAINSVIDCEALQKAAYGSLYELDSSYIGNDQVWYSQAGAEFFNQKDVEKGKQLLAKSQYNGEKLRILVSSDTMALVLQQQIAQIGINSEILLYDSATVSQYRNDPALYDVYITTWIPHPVPPMKPYLAPEFAGWADDETLQGYFDEFYAAPTVEEAKAIWDKAQYYCWSDYVPVLFLGNVVSARAWNEKVEGIVSFSGLFFWNATVSE